MQQCTLVQRTLHYERPISHVAKQTTSVTEVVYTQNIFTPINKIVLYTQALLLEKEKFHKREAIRYENRSLFLQRGKIFYKREVPKTEVIFMEKQKTFLREHKYTLSEIVHSVQLSISNVHPGMCPLYKQKLICSSVQLSNVSYIRTKCTPEITHYISFISSVHSKHIHFIITMVVYTKPIYTIPSNALVYTQITYTNFNSDISVPQNAHCYNQGATVHSDQMH